MNTQNCSLNASEAQSTAQYINSFLDLVENLPNEISRHLSQLHQLNNNYLKLINRTDTNVDRYKQVITALASNRPNSSDDKVSDDNDMERSDDSMETLIEKRRKLSKKIETQLIQIQELSDEKLRYSQIIFDLIETKAKELDLDYEEMIQFNGRINSNISESAVNRINGSASNKISANNSSLNGTNIGTTSQIKEETKQKEVTEDISKIIDKRSLPRRACALKSGQSVDPNDEIIETNVAKVTQNKTNKSKSFSKCHNFGLSMSNFYRNMARRRAKLPKGTKIHKIGSKISDNKKSVQPLKQTDRKSKPNRNSIKRLIAAKSGVKPTNRSTTLHKKLVRNKSTNGYLSSSSSSSSSSMSDDNDVFDAPNGSESRNNSQKKDKNSNQENGKRESKRSANNYINNNNSNNSNNKKNKTNSNSFQPTDQFVGEPIDPNEPTYCLCEQVSFGQMICCDNDRCTLEWFHFPCVGLEVKPKGKWYCPRCRKAPKIQNVPKRQSNSAKD